MQNIIILLLLTVLQFSIYGQSKDDLIIKQEMSFSSNVIDCKNVSGKPHCNSFLPLTKEDSLKNCFYVKTFKTNRKNVFYQKEYNILNTLIAEGRIAMFKNKVGSGKFEERFYKIDIWKEFDLANKKIHFLDYAVAHSENTYVGKILGDSIKNMYEE